MTAKVPITVFNYPLMSIITSTTTNTNTNTNKSTSSSDFTFSLSTNFPTGPTLRLSYSTSLTSSLPFSLSLKSGLSLFGSPRNSPLIFSANFPLSLSTTTHTPPPSFFLHFKPQFGHFSLNKTVFSDDNNNNNNALPLSLPLDNPQIDKGFVASSPYESSSGWQNLNLEPYTTKESNNHGVVMTETENNPKRGLSPALAIMARTVVPVTQGLLLNFRWGVNFMGKSGFKIPYLTVNKIGLERVDEVKQKKKDIDEKGMLFGMRKELESVEKENREIKRVLDEIMKKGVSNSNSKSSTTTTREGKKRSDNDKVGNKQKKSFQHWENNNGNEINKVKQPNQNKPPPPPQQQSAVVGSDLESELQKAIKAAASNSY